MSDQPKLRHAIEASSFKIAVKEAEPGDKIVYYTGWNCARAPSRLWARGAYEAGLVLLAKKKLNNLGEDSIYQHIAIRTKTPFKAFVKAVDEEL